MKYTFSRHLGRWMAFASALAIVACGGNDDSRSDRNVPLSAATAPAPPVAAPQLVGDWQKLPNPFYAPPAGPYGRAWTEMLWDPELNQMVVFGGNGGTPTGYGNDIWTYNPTTTRWTNIEPFEYCPGSKGFDKPNGSDDTAFEYDPYNKLYWAFGLGAGYRCLQPDIDHTAGAGTTTTIAVDPTLTPPQSGSYVDWTVWIGGVTARVTAYDAALGKLTLERPIPALAAGVVFKLYANLGAGVWYFDPVTKKWVGQDTPTGRTGPTPTPTRYAPAVAYSDADRAFALFGTSTSGEDRSVWKLDVTTKLWTQLPVPATGAPPAMAELLNSFVYDKANDVFILFGGRCSGNFTVPCPEASKSGKTWAYKLSTNTWTDMNPPVAPAARDQHQMAYDSVNGVVTLYGGVLSDLSKASDTWYYHYPSNTWTQVTTALNPRSRFLGQVVYDPQYRRTVLFGGVDPVGMTSEIWALTLVPAGGSAPTVSLAAVPGNGGLVAPASLSLEATATDSDGTVVRVDFYDDQTLLGARTAAPFTLSLTGVAAGAHSYRAVATDDSGNSTTSAAVGVQVSAPQNQPPSVSLTAPAIGATYTAPASITLTASASDSDGSIAKVEFFSGATKLGESTSAPFAWTWTSVAAGSYSLSARATDDRGAQTTSAAVGVQVSAPQNQPPSVSLTAPATGATYTAPASITLTASASDSDGSIAKVEFFSGATKLGEATTAPYALNWTSVPAGSYALTARATDNAGASTTSAIATVTVNSTSSPSVNVALQANGGVATASSTYSAGYPTVAANDGSRTAANWGNGGGWNDANALSYPDWLQVAFSGSKTINRIDVFTLADNFSTGAQPTATTTFTQYGLTSFDVQYWSGSAWVTVPGGSVTGNNLVWRTFTFPSVTTDRIRVVVNASLYWYSRIVEIEAWTQP